MPTVTRTKPYDAKKGATIESARELYSKSAGVLFSDYRGLSVKDIQNLRQTLKKKGADIHVLKNTLFRIAAGNDVDQMPADLHNGPTAIAFVFENEAECAKVLVDFATSSKKLVVKGGFFGGKAFSAKDVESLSKLPPRDVLIAQVIGAIAAPLTTLVGTIEALYADPIRVIGAVSDKVGGGAGADEAPAAAATAVSEPEPAPASEEVPVTAEEPSEAPAEAEAAEAPTSAEESAAPEGE